MFCYRVAKYVASYVVPLGGLDALVFTGGIGERSPIKRARILEMLQPLGFTVHEERNKVKNTGVKYFQNIELSLIAFVYLKIPF